MTRYSDYYHRIKADPERYEAYLAKKRKESARRQRKTGYETQRKRQWRARNPELTQKIRKAGHAVEKALRNGVLVKPPTCSSCGKKKRIEAHHHRGYEPDFWLDVEWLCGLCHAGKHRFAL